MTEQSFYVCIYICYQVCEERCLKRGAEGSGRVDDNIDSLRKRFQTYQNDTMPIIEFYNQQDLVHKIHGDQTPEKVNSKL